MGQRMTSKLVLVVEDNSDDEELMLLALAEAGGGFDIAVVHDGEEAIEFLQSTGRYARRDRYRVPNLVLLDINVPKLNGIEVLGLMRADRLLATVPVVMVTTSNQPADLREAYAAGANSYVLKPVDYDHFVSTIARVRQYWLEFNQPAPDAA